MKNLIIALSIILCLCCHQTIQKKNTLIQLNGILYKDEFNNYYFQYKFPERKAVNKCDQGFTKYGYDSLVNLKSKLVVLKKVIDLKTFKIINGIYQDCNYIYIENKFLNSPKFDAEKIAK